MKHVGFIDNYEDEEEEDWERQSPFIGIMEDNAQFLERYKNSDSWDANGYQLAAGGGYLSCRLNSKEMNLTGNHECYWNQVGDILEITLDLDERTLSFKVNDIDYGVAVSNIKKTKYRLAFTTYREYTEIVLL